MRRRNWSLVILGLTLLAASLACDEDPAGPAGDGAGPGIVGTVLDAEGVPVAGAPVGMIYGIYNGQDGWPPEEFGGPAPAPRETIVLHFTLEEPSTVRLLIEDFRYRTRRVLIDEADLEAGVHQVEFDWKDDAGLPLPNNLYGTCLIIAGPGLSAEVRRDGGLLRNALSLEFGSEIGALVTTDAEGGFRIPYTELPIGEWSYCLDGEDGICTIPDTLWVQSAQGDTQARRLLSIEGFQFDLPVTLPLAQRRD